MQTERHINQSYGQHIMPSSPLVYRLVEKSARFGFALATARKTHLLIDVISFPIRPPPTYQQSLTITSRKPIIPQSCVSRQLRTSVLTTDAQFIRATTTPQATRKNFIIAKVLIVRPIQRKPHHEKLQVSPMHRLLS